jgi:hypothetical protein
MIYPCYAASVIAIEFSVTGLVVAKVVFETITSVPDVPTVRSFIINVVPSDFDNLAIAATPLAAGVMGFVVGAIIDNAPADAALNALPLHVQVPSKVA